MIVALVLLCVALYFPIRSYDWMDFSWRVSHISETGILEHGFQFLPSYIILIWMAASALILSNLQTKTGAILGVISSILPLLYMPLYAFVLVWGMALFRDSPTNESILYGYGLVFGIILLYNILTIVHFRKMRKKEAFRLKILR
ncbi:MAG: hypothetical protein ACI865_002560 [Flavobacteriaceae bacterium]